MKRRIGFIHGSDSDLLQLEKGLIYLRSAAANGWAEVLEVTRGSIHRNTDFVLGKCRYFLGKIDVFILAAGWANHLTGMAAAYILYTLQHAGIVVVGIACEDKENKKHTNAAIDSIRFVPGTQVVYKDNEGDFIGEDGALRACKFAVEGELPLIKIPKEKPEKERSLEGALEAIQEMKKTINEMKICK